MDKKKTEQPSALQLGPDCQAEIVQELDQLVVKLQGKLNEDADLGEIHFRVAALTPKPRSISFDLGKVQVINSCGVRNWLVMIEQLQAKFQCSFLDLSEAMVEQAGDTPAMLGRPGTTISSFSAPYFCPRCDRREQRKLEVSKWDAQSAGTFVPPAFSCAKCQGSLEFDSLPDAYTRLIRRALAK
jgi:hypothetical protein